MTWAGALAPSKPSSDVNLTPSLSSSSQLSQHERIYLETGGGWNAVHGIPPDDRERWNKAYDIHPEQELERIYAHSSRPRG